MNNHLPSNIKQSNLITSARYEYTVWEKRILYQVIRRLQSNPPQNLFEHFELVIPVADVLKGESKNYHHVKRAVRTLQGRTFEYEHGNWGDEDYEWFYCGFINHAIIRRGTGVIETEVNKLIMPYLVELASNFTTYNLVVAMSLKSIYSQRFYEFCSRFKDTGKWNVSVDHLREMLMLEEKYLKYPDFKINVLETARKELESMYQKSECDVCFTYDELKTGRQVTDLRFNIKWERKNQGAEESSQEDLQLIHEYLRMFWPEVEGRRKQVFKAINEMKAFKDFRKKADEIISAYPGKRPADLGGILTKALRTDFGLKV